MDWNAVVALAAIAALLLTLDQMRRERANRRVDFYRRLTPFVSFDVAKLVGAPSDAIEVYVDGGGPAFMVEANIEPANPASPGWPGQNTIRYLRPGGSDRIAFKPGLGDGFKGAVVVTFVDMFRFKHAARRAIQIVGGNIETRDVPEWACGGDCRVHRPG